MLNKQEVCSRYYLVYYISDQINLYTCALGPTWVAKNATALPPKLRASLLQSHLSPTVLEILVDNFATIDKDHNCKLSVEEIMYVF